MPWTAITVCHHRPETASVVLSLAGRKVVTAGKQRQCVRELNADCQAAQKEKAIVLLVYSAYPIVDARNVQQKGSDDEVIWQRVSTSSNPPLRKTQAASCNLRPVPRAQALGSGSASQIWPIKCTEFWRQPVFAWKETMTSLLCPSPFNATMRLNPLATATTCLRCLHFAIRLTHVGERVIK